MIKFDRLTLPVEGSQKVLNLSLGLNSVLLSSTRIIPTRAYGVLGFFPELVLDFESEKYFTDRRASSFSNAITHTRASTATYVDSTGTLQTAAINEPRLGHHVWNGTAWVNEGLLHESEARTNLVTYSEDFANAYWTKANNVTVIANASASPDGNTTATSLAANGTTGFQQLSRSLSLADNTDFNLSVHYKANVGCSGVRLALTGKDAITRHFNGLSNGTLGPSSGASNVNITFLGNGWYRLSGTINSFSGATTPSYRIYPTNSDGEVSTFVSGDGVFLWGAQLEAAPTVSSYIPTNSGSTVTRSADVLTIPAANLPYPEPVVIGPELVTNGTFDSDLTGWSQTGSDFTWSSGGASGVATGGTVTTLHQIATTEIGKVYKFDFTISGIANLDGSDAFATIRSSGPNGGDANVDASINGLGNGSHSFVFVATSTTSYVSFKFTSGSEAGDAFTVDNISVREINPLALSIQMDGRVTYANTWVSGTKAEFIPFRWFADTNNSILHVGDSLDAGDTRLTVQQKSSGASSFSTISDFLSPEILVPINTASRHGSNFLRSAADGVLGGSATPTALPDLSATNLSLGNDYNGTIRTFRMWGQDVTDAGLIEATS